MVTSKKVFKIHIMFFVFMMQVMFSQASFGQDTLGSSSVNNADLAQELTNPLADLVTVPIQMNYDYNIGLDDEGTKLQTNIQPVIPFHISDEWNIVSRTIMPVTFQDDIFSESGSQFGLGDISLNLFLSPKQPTSNGIIWGAGPIILFPSATDSLLGAKKWGGGPTGIVLKFQGPWTYGALGNHVWSFAGDDDRMDIDNTFLQPFVAYTMSNAWSISVQSETTYNWDREEWAVPVNLAASKLVMLGRLPVSLQAGIGYWVESPDAGAEGFRFRLQANFVLPKF
jgi:hypothetical protein